MAITSGKTLVAVEDNTPSKDDVLRIEWNIGKRCNFDCSYCSPSIHSKAGEDLSLEVVERTAQKLVSHARGTGRSIRISLTGGEPYLHPQFLDLLKLLKDQGVDRISITSNGSMPTERYLKSLDYVDYLIVSVHFEFIRVEKLKERVKAIHQQLKKHQRLHLHIMMLPGKVQEGLQLARELEEMGISYVLRRVRPQFDAEGLFLEPHQSGQLGRPRGDWEKIRQAGATYYSSDELALMGVEL